MATYTLTITGTPATLRRSDWRQVAITDGVITGQVTFKADASSPEQPFANGRVWLLRRVDGYKAVECWADAGGVYSASGLEEGCEYMVTAIDPYGTYTAVSAFATAGDTGVNLVFGEAGAGGSYTPSAFYWDGSAWQSIGVAQWNGTAWN